MTRKHGSGEHIDPAVIAEVVRNALLDDMTREEPPPHVVRTWRMSVLFTAFLLMLAGFWNVGRVMGWN